MRSFRGHGLELRAQHQATTPTGRLARVGPPPDDRLDVVRAHRVGLVGPEIEFGVVCDVDDTVTVLAVVLHEGAAGVDGAVDDELDRARLQHEGLVVAVAVLRTGVGDELHAPDVLVVLRRLRGVAGHEDDRVPAGDRERVAVRVVLHQADELLELVELEVGLVGQLADPRVLVRRLVVPVLQLVGTGGTTIDLSGLDFPGAGLLPAVIPLGLLLLAIVFAAVWRRDRSWIVFSVAAGLGFRRQVKGGTAIFYAVIISLTAPGYILGIGIGLMFNLFGWETAWYSSALGSQLSWTLPFGVLITFAVFGRCRCVITPATWIREPSSASRVPTIESTPSAVIRSRTSAIGWSARVIPVAQASAVASSASLIPGSIGASAPTARCGSVSGDSCAAAPAAHSACRRELARRSSAPAVAQSTRWLTTSLASSRSSMLFQGPRLRTSSALNSELNASAIALSYESPLEPTEVTASASARRSV